MLSKNYIYPIIIFPFKNYCYYSKIKTKLKEKTITRFMLTLIVITISTDIVIEDIKNGNIFYKR